MEKSDLVESFCNNVTLHAVAPLYRSRSTCGKLFWAIVLTLATLTTAYILYGVVSDFLLSPTATSITVESMKNMTFPDVLICNNHLLNRSYLQEKNISAELVLYIQSIFMFSWNEIERRYPIDLEQELDAQYQSLLLQYPNQDVRQFFFDAGLTTFSIFLIGFASSLIYNSCCRSRLQPILH